MTGLTHGTPVSHPQIPGRIVQHSRFCSGVSGQRPDTLKWNPTQSSGTPGGVYVNDTTTINGRLFILTGNTSGSIQSVWTLQNRRPTNTSLLTCFQTGQPSAAEFNWTMRAQDYTGVQYPPNCYTLRFAPNSFDLFKVVASASTSIGTGSFTVGINTPVWLRWELKGSLLTVKAWNDTSPEPATPLISVYDDTWPHAGACMIASRTNAASVRQLELCQYTLYVPQEMPNPLAQIFAPILSAPVTGVSRTLAAEVDIASDAEAAISKTARYLAKIASSPSAKAISVFNRGLVSPISTSITTVAALAVGGTVSFSATISETKNLRLHRVAAPDVSGLPRAYQAAVSGSTMVRPTLRRAVRRTGKMAASTSGRATISYRKLFTVVGSLNKPRFSISAKAVLSTTTTAQGNAPAIPATISAGVPGAKMIGSGHFDHYYQSMTTYQAWKGQGWGGHGITPWGGTTMKGSSAINESSASNSPYATQRGLEGYGVVGLNANAGDPNLNVRREIGLGRAVAADPTGVKGYFVIDLPIQVNWWDDVEAAALANKWGGWGAGLKFLGFSGIYTDSEGKNWRGTQGHTFAELMVKVEQRGYEVGLKLYEAFPDCHLDIYSGVPSGTLWDRVYHGGINSTSNYDTTTPAYTYNTTPSGLVGNTAEYAWWLGFMRAGAARGSTGTIATLDHRIGYRMDYYGLAASAEDAMRASWAGMIDRFSKDLAPAVRDHWMGKLHYKIYHFGDTDCFGTPSGSNFLRRTQPDAATWNSWLMTQRKFSGGGERWEFVYNNTPNGTPSACSRWGSGTGGVPAVQGLNYSNAYNAVPTRTTGMQAAASTASHDTMVVSGAPTGTASITVVGRGADPTATVPLELTATLFNGTTAAIENPGVGFYTVPGNVNIGWAASGAIPLPAGQSRTYSTLTSPLHSQYTPSAAGTVTLRAKPGDAGVDSDTGTRDQTFTVAAAPPPPPSGARPFTSTSSWNTPVPVGATFTDRPELRTSNWWFDASDFGIVVYTSTPSDPLVTVSIPFNSWNWPISSTQIRIASGVDGAEGSDGTLCVVSGTDVWDFWQFNRISDTTASCSASAHTSVTTGTGWSLGGGQAAGIRSAGCSSLAGLIQGNTLTNGFDHALAVALRFELVSSAMVRDAISSDGQGPGSAIPMGSRLAIPSNVPRPGTVTSSIAINIWNACKTYGVYVVDTMGGGTVGGFAGNVNTVTQAQTDILLNAGVWNSPELTAIGHALQLVNL